MERQDEFSERYVLVTGASGGIGSRIAGDFLARGAHVGVHFRRDRAAAAALVRVSKPGMCKAFQADFSRKGGALKLWKEYIRWSGGKIDILVNNAGEVVEPQYYDVLTERVWQKTFMVNTYAPFVLGRAALSLMKKQRSGRIVNMSSIGVKFGGSPTTVHYSASKAALEAVTRSLAKFAAPYNVLVNCVRVGVTDTLIHAKASKKQMKARIALIPLGRPAKPSEISNAVLFLAGGNSTFIANTILEVNGGE